MNSEILDQDNSFCIPLGELTNHGLILLDIVNYLKSKLQVEALYLTGVHSSIQSRDNLIRPNWKLCLQRHQIDLLLLCKKIPHNAIADLSSYIKSSTNGEYAMNLLLHKTTEVRKSNSQHQNFFKTVLKRGCWLCGCLSLESLLPKEQAIKVSRTEVQTYYKERLTMAKHLLNMEYSLESDTVSLLKVSILHQAVEQICLALIFKFLHYHPNHFHLQYLLNICKGFTHIGEVSFPQHSKQDIELFNILSQSVYDTRHKHADRYKLFHVQLLEERCRTFYESATALMAANVSDINDANY